MRKIKFTLVVGLVFLMVAMFVGCDPEAFSGGSGEKTGSLLIKLSEPKAKDLDGNPGISTEIKNFVISGEGPGNRTFGPITISGTDTALVTDLYEGDWDVTVLGLNEDDYAIGACTKPVTIIANRQTTETFIVEDFTGEGTFKIEVQWPAGEVNDPHILVEVSKVIGEAADDSWVMTPIEGESKAVKEKTLAAGSYSVTIAIYEGDPGNGGKWLTGVNGSFLIIDGKTEQASFAFDGDSLRVFGGLSVTIEDAMPVLFSVALSKNSDRVWDGHPATLTATPSLPGEYAYYWFIDGKLQDEETNNFVLDDQLTYGAHFIGVTVLKNGIFASAHTTVTYGDDPGLFFVLQLLESGTDTVLHTFNLTLTVPNYGYASTMRDWGELVHATLTCANIIERYEPTTDPNDWETISTVFYPTIVSRTIEHEGSSMVVSDLTMIELALYDFLGVGTYTSDEDDLGGYFLTTHLDSNNTLYGNYSAESGYITITEYGEVGGIISGSAFLENATFEDLITDEEDLTFDIKANFSLKRDNDYIIKMRKLTYIINGDTPMTVRSYKPVGVQVWLTPRFKIAEQIYNIDGWSTEPGESGDIYDNDTNPLTMPDEDITLYAIFPD